MEVLCVLSFLTVIFMWLSIRCGDKASLKAHPASLYPSFFFDEVFSSCNEEDRAKVATLQDNVVALQHTSSTDSPIGLVSQSIKDIEKKYEECLSSYLSNFQASEKTRRVLQLRNKIDLGHKVIEKEKDAFLSDNGNTVSSFLFNRQNHLTDILLTSICIPLILEILKWDVKNVNDFAITMEEKPMLLIVFVIFWIIVLYRIMKYFKNKRSMLNSMRQTVLYDKAELMLCTFECAFKDIEKNAIG